MEVFKNAFFKIARLMRRVHSSYQMEIACYEIAYQLIKSVFSFVPDVRDLRILTSFYIIAFYGTLN